MNKERPLRNNLWSVNKFKRKCEPKTRLFNQHFHLKKLLIALIQIRFRTMGILILIR